MGNPNVYDIFLGILYYLPKNKQQFKYNEEKIIDFLKKNQNDYDLLMDFTPNQIKAGLDLLAYGIAKEIPENPGRKRFDPDKVDMAFKIVSDQRFNELDLLELEELSREFTGKFVI